MDIHILPPAAKASVEIIKADCVFVKTVRIWVKINGLVFLRIWDKSGNYQAYWNDEEYNIGDTLAIQDKDKENELESIFKAYCLEQGVNALSLIDNTI